MCSDQPGIKLKDNDNYIANDILNPTFVRVLLALKWHWECMSFQPMFMAMTFIDFFLTYQKSLHFVFLIKKEKIGYRISSSRGKMPLASDDNPTCLRKGWLQKP